MAEPTIEKKVAFARWFLMWTCIIGAVGSFVYWRQLQPGDLLLAPAAQQRSQPQQPGPERVPEAVAERLPERIPESLSERVPEPLPDRLPEQFPERSPERTPELLPERGPQEEQPDRQP